MSEHINIHAIERAITEASHGTIRSINARLEQLGYDQLQEVSLGFQLPLDGIARGGPGYKKFTVAFDVEFFFMPYQNDIPLTMPHFEPGAVIRGEPSPPGSDVDPNNPDSMIDWSASVIDWSIDTKTGAINGAVVGVSVTTNGGQDVAFDGWLHLTFTGYGAPPENIAALDIGQ